MTAAPDELEAVTATGTTSNRPPTPPVARWPSPGGAVRAATLWLAARILLMAVVATAAVKQHAGVEVGFDRVLGFFSFWDSTYYLRIADLGYLPPGRPCCDQAFLPGYPLAVRFLSVVTGDPRLAAVSLSVLAGSVAAGLMWHLGWITTGDERVAANATLFMAVAPYGVFFSVAYTESLFLMFSLGAWAAATRRHWWLAGGLAAGATSVRINGVFLLAGLVVMYLVQLRANGRRRPRWDVLALSVPVLPMIAFFTWLHHRTGSWHAWSDAEKQGWGRHGAPPWTGLQMGVRWMLEAPTWHGQLSAAADLVAIGVGIVLIAALIQRRRWPEVTYMTANILVLLCSNMLLSSARYSLGWFPGYLVLAELSVQPEWRWLTTVLVTACLPALVWLSYLFASRIWMG